MSKPTVVLPDGDIEVWNFEHIPRRGDIVCYDNVEYIMRRMEWYPESKTYYIVLETLTGFAD